MLRLNRAAGLLAISLLAFAGAITAGHVQGHGYGYGQGQGPGYGMGGIKHHGGPYLPGRSAAETHNRARLGVAITAVPLTELDTLGLEYGVRVTKVLSGSPADQAGVRSGDVITAIADRPAYSPERLRHLVEASGASAKVELRRGDSTLTMSAEMTTPDSAAGNAVLGLRVQPMTGDLQEAFGAEDGRGVLVSQVYGGTPASRTRPDGTA